MASEEDPRYLEGEALLAAISREMTRMHTEPTTEGAVTARSYRNEEMISCILGGTLTNAERVLIDNGRAKQVLALRRAFQVAMRERFAETVERLSGRHVAAVMSQSCLDPDLALAVFFLATDGDLAAGGR